MYKKFTLQQLTSIKNNFLTNLTRLMKSQKLTSVRDFLNKNLKYGDEVIFFRRGDGFFRLQKEGENYIISDEREKIQIILPKDKISTLNSYAIKYFTQNQSKKNKKLKSIEEILGEEVKKGTFETINGKNFLIYDIETTSYQQDITKAKFLLAYMATPKKITKNGEEIVKFDYKLIADKEIFDQEKNFWELKKFVDFMLNFDGYIIGFNSIGFDNVVCVNQAGYGEKELEILNQKSLDIFLFFYRLIGRRISLNKVAEGLVGVSKTLSSGTEVEKLLKKYQESGDQKLLKETKTYCKNDVRMTLLVLLYLLYYKKIYREGQEIFFDLEQFIELSSHKKETKENTNKEKKITQTSFF